MKMEKDYNRTLFVVFQNDNQKAMNVIANNETDIKNWIESNFECKWEDIKDVEDVTTFEENEDDSFFSSKFTDLRQK